MSYPKIGEFRETRYNDSIHEVFDAGLQFGAVLHRFINAGGTECSAIYANGAQIWWVYTNGNALGDSESVMIKDWQNLDLDITKI